MASSFQLFFSTFFIFFFFLPHITSSAIICKTESCSDIKKSSVKFRFRLKSSEARGCGYPGFGLSCNNQNKTILTLPYSGDFVVERIDYVEQSICIDDPNHCFVRSFLQNFNLSGSPFKFVDLENFTFFNCSSNEMMYRNVRDIPCVSGDNYSIWVTPSAYSELLARPPSCRVILVALLPLPPSPLLELTWGEPNCGERVAGDGFCARKSAASRDVGCVSVASSNGGLPRTAKYGITIGVGIPGLLCLIGLSCYLCGRVRAYRRGNNPNTELTSIVIPQRTSALAVGLDGPTIASYPKTLLGESRRLPKPNDNTCPICLCEYQPKEELRTIPECNHYFHANCIDEWLKLNATCPLCRNSPDGSALGTPSSSSVSSSSSSSLISS